MTDTLEHVLPIPVVREPDRRKPSTAGVVQGQNRSERLDRLVNITLASLGLVLAAPIMLVFAILVKLTSPGPIFYAQARVGLDRRRSGVNGPYDRRTRDLGGRAFMILKFRTMRVDAEKNGAVWAAKQDARVTRVGRVMRKYRIDELPQLWNVLVGDMSIVGPRPERPHFVEQFRHRIPQYMLRHKVKAGLTGWAQVNGWRGNTALEKRIEYDLYYIENWSVRLDLKIMWLTLTKSFFHRHAY